MRIDRVYVSWTEHWDVSRYVEEYLRTRRRPPDAHAQILKQIEQYTGESPFTKSSLDYFLDANFSPTK